ncbi:VRR-NUC domain-containing protein [Deinococcus sp. Leaf326]|uniref:VRR-NUC domain-containing protein n=1 Tax=Deinococcus sp. Leaf326 TaxID=1736338 RepID=UPI0006F209B5|nr:VRR-NUC domain-containing protein [Deinococcus sp. Leaf326]KQR37753.1 hypothetical protein ASF71_14830 [Deinococcus sp. Leaf326]
MSRALAARLLAQAVAEDEAYACKLHSVQEEHWDENAHQIRFITWAAETWPTLPALEGFHHSPNGGARAKRTGRDGRLYSPEALRLQLMGVRAGYPDLLLDVAVGDWHGLRIELKALDGELSTNQRPWLVRLRREGYYADVARGWRDARRLTLEYLSGQFTEYRWAPRFADRHHTLPPYALNARSRRAR